MTWGWDPSSETEFDKNSRLKSNLSAKNMMLLGNVLMQITESISLWFSSSRKNFLSFLLTEHNYRKSKLNCVVTFLTVLSISSRSQYATIFRQQQTKLCWDFSGWSQWVIITLCHEFLWISFLKTAKIYIFLQIHCKKNKRDFRPMKWNV